MGNTIRFTGLSSGLDTESIVKAIMTPYQTKIDKINKNQTLAEWRKDAYKEMSTKIQNFRNNALSKIKYASTLNKSKVEMSQEGAIKVDTSNYTEDGTHKIQVTQIAEKATVKVNTIRDTAGNKLTSDSKISEIAGMPASGDITINGRTFRFDSNTKISDLEDVLSTDDINVKFDASAGAFLINSKETGISQKIEISSTDSKVLTAMGIQGVSANGVYSCQGKNAEITYNDGVNISSESNDIEVNGLKFTATATTTQPVTVTISKDIDGMVEAITDFVKEYNTLLEEINSKVSVDSAKGYEPLTDEEKEAMTEKEIEKWEEKIKGAIFRNDSTLKDLGSMLRQATTNDYSKSDGLNKECSMLVQLGISSSNWSERGKLTVDEKKLRAALTDNGDDAISLLTTMANNIEQELNKRSTSTEFRSYGQYFSDKVQTDNIAQYKKDIITAQAKYDKLESMYYKKFTAMETAMNKMNSQSSLFSSL